MKPGDLIYRNKISFGQCPFCGEKRLNFNKNTYLCGYSGVITGLDGGKRGHIIKTICKRFGKKKFICLESIKAIIDNNCFVRTIDI